MEMKIKEITWKSFFYYAVPTMISAMFLAWILPIKNDWIQCIPLILSYICLEISCFRSDKKLGIVAILLLLISYFLFTKGRHSFDWWTDILSFHDRTFIYDRRNNNDPSKNISLLSWDYRSDFDHNKTRDMDCNYWSFSGQFNELPISV